MTLKELFEQHRADDPHCTCNDCVAYHFEGQTPPDAPAGPVASPGPWEADGHVGVYSLPRSRMATYIDQKDGLEKPYRHGLVALVYSTPEDSLGGQINGEANARLIQAAPDMADALMALYIRMRENETIGHSVADYAAAEAALRKAGRLA
jgi:hypothetical protein